MESGSSNMDSGDKFMHVRRDSVPAMPASILFCNRFLLYFSNMLF